MVEVAWAAIALLGVVVFGLFGAFLHLSTKMDTRFDAVYARFDSVDARFDALIGRMDARFDAMDARLDSHLEKGAG